GCTPHRDGWVRWYKGRTRFVCGKRTPLEDVEDRWFDLKRSIDSEAVQIIAGRRTYRQVMSEFLDVQKARIGAKRNSIQQRTYDNYAGELNKFGSFRVHGRKIADMDIREIGPVQFSAYAAKLG